MARVCVCHVSQDLYSKYKFIELRLAASKANLKGKMPEMKKTLEVSSFVVTSGGCVRMRGVNSVLDKYEYLV